MAELAGRLAEALGAGYRLERELGGGGMSRVFVAEELALGRLVVVKVLPPELAVGVSLERFQREVRLAAQLQHPHVVPLLAAGGAGDLFWYSMPLVEGESLRARIAREHALPIPFALRVLREVADALSHAHARGVVHRDIKPDNVLIAGRHAMVTDFGVARALHASAGEGSAITSTGLAVGTPGYMAPEQASAETTIDARADLYALGVLGWEMLAGRPLFVGSTPQVLAAHVSRVPEAVSSYRPQVPHALEAAVMRCLEKNPADRWQSADELLAALDAVVITDPGATPAVATAPHAQAAVAAASHPAPDEPREGIGTSREAAAAVVSGDSPPSPGRARPWSRRWSLLALAAVLAVAAFGLVRQRGAAAADVPQRRMFVADFEDQTGDSTLGRAATEAMRVALSQSDRVTDVPAGTIRAALVRMRRPPGQRLDAETARELAQREGIPLFVTGTVARVGSGIQLVARIESPDSGGREVALFREAAAGEGDVLTALDRLGRALRRGIGESARRVRESPALPAVSTGSLEALRAYADGYHAYYFDDDEARALPLFERAIALDPDFASAHRAIGTMLSNRNRERARARESLRRAFELRDRLPERERLRTESIYWSRAEVDRGKAAAALRLLLAEYPDDQAALNNLAVIHQDDWQFDSAVVLFERAARVDTMNPLPVRNLAFLFSILGRMDEAERELRRLEARGLNPTLVLYRAGFFAVRGEHAAADSVLDAMERANRTNPGVRATALVAQGSFAAFRGRMREAGLRHDEASELLDDLGAQSSALGEQVNMAMIEIMAAGEAERGVRRLERALSRWPLASLRPPDRPYHGIALVYALAGRSEPARAMIARYETEMPDSIRRSEAPFPRQIVRSVLAFNEGRMQEAAEEAVRRDEGRAFIAPALFHGLALERQGAADSAIAVYEAALKPSAFFRIFDDGTGRIRMSDPMWRMQVEQRLSALHERKGDSARAAALCEAVVERWRGADPEMRPVVQECEQRAARMRGRVPG